MFDRLAHLNSLDRTASHPPVSPRSAVSFVLVDRREAEFKFLMGRRPVRQAFMPDVYVFPGGAVETDDLKFTELALELSNPPLPFEAGFDQTKAALSPCLDGLNKPADCAAAFLCCGARETFEETGLDLYYSSVFTSSRPVTADWLDFRKRVIYFARAITPPGRAKRFDTHFFIIDVDGFDLNLARPTPELTDLQWVTYEAALALPLHVMTRVMIEDVKDCLAEQARNSPGLFIQPFRLPFYQWSGSGFSRSWIEIKSSP